MKVLLNGQRVVNKMAKTNPSSQFAHEAEKNSLPMLSGLSGVTMQFQQIGRIFNLRQEEAMTLACLGFLMSTYAHNHHEVRVVSQYFDVDYSLENPYQLPLISEQEIIANCGKIP